MKSSKSKTILQVLAVMLMAMLLASCGGDSQSSSSSSGSTASAVTVFRDSERITFHFRGRRESSSGTFRLFR